MLKNKKFSFSGLLFNVMIGLMVGLFFQVNLLCTIGLVLLGGALLSFAPAIKGIARVGLLKELWLDQLMENFYPDGSFLSRSQDMSALVDYNKLNLAEIGVDPKVLVDNTSYPVPTVQRVDKALELPLSTLDTENTLVRNVEEMETAYAKMESVLRQHRKSLQKKACMLAAYNWAPQATGQFTPIQKTTGTGGAMTFDDIINMAGIFDDMDLPVEGRIMLLSPRHRRQLQSENLKMYKEALATKDLFGFIPYVFSKNPTYTAVGAKNPFEAAGNPATIFYHEDEVMKAEGTTDMFVTYKSPEQRGDIVGFQMRFAALSIRKKYMGALYSA